MTQAFPLRWPEGWPRTAAHKRSDGNQFGQMKFVGSNTYKTRARLTPDVARRGLYEELQRLGAQNVTLSSNVPLRLDGQMKADAADRGYADPGVAIYFTLKGRATVMAQDNYLTIAANMRSLSLAVEAMRALERHGGGTMMSKAFDGFAALPPPEGAKPKRPWWEVLRYSPNPEDRDLLSVAEVKARFKTLAKRFHPDAGGSSDEMSELNDALAEATADIERGA